MIFNFVFGVFPKWSTFARFTAHFILGTRATGLMYYAFTILSAGKRVFLGEILIHNICECYNILKEERKCFLDLVRFVDDVLIV